MDYWGGGKGMLAPLSNYLGGGGLRPPPPAPPLPTPIDLYDFSNLQENRLCAPTNCLHEHRTFGMPNNLRLGMPNASARIGF